jgi:hypothetical protein
MLLTFVGCKEKAIPDPYNGDINSVIKEFKILGVGDENIRLAKDKIFVKLPADYPYGQVIKPTVKLNNQFQLLTNINEGLRFEGQSLALKVKSDLYGEFGFSVYVTPTAPLVLASGTDDINISIDPDAAVQFLMENVGTLTVENEKGELSSEPRVTLKNTATGQIVECSSLMYQSQISPAAKLHIEFPVNIAAADYQASVRWGGREAKIPNLIKVKYGKLGLNFFSWVINSENPILSIPGYNILPDNEYELEIKNDFTPARKVKLIRKGYNELTASLAGELSPGNYNAKILVNSQEYKRTNGILEPIFANLIRQATGSQPVIVNLSQPSLLITGECYYYPQTTQIFRAQEIVANIWFTGEKENTQFGLKLVNQETKKEYLLTTSTPRFSGMCNSRTMSKFPIPNDLTNGKYKVYAVVGSTDMMISEPMAQLVTIE